jgi:hypothetical protein
MENEKQKTESDSKSTRYVQAALKGRACEIFDELATLLPIGDSAIIKTLILKYGPAEIADLKPKSGIHADANSSGEEHKDTKLDEVSQ